MDRRTQRPIARLVGVIGLAAALLATGLGGMLPVGHAAADTFVKVCPTVAACSRANDVRTGLLPPKLALQPGGTWLEIHLGTNAGPNDTVVLHFAVLNQGPIAAGPFHVRVEDYPDLADGGPVLDSELPGLAAGASVPLATAPMPLSYWSDTGRFKAYVFLNGIATKVDLALAR